jgi:hypothetical protein
MRVEFYVSDTKVCTGELDESVEASGSSLNQVLDVPAGAGPAEDGVLARDRQPRRDGGQPPAHQAVLERLNINLG